jgi:hypothetical protein
MTPTYNFLLNNRWLNLNNYNKYEFEKVRFHYQDHTLNLAI